MTNPLNDSRLDRALLFVADAKAMIGEVWDELPAGIAEAALRNAIALLEDATTSIWKAGGR